MAGLAILTALGSICCYTVFLMPADVRIQVVSAANGRPTISITPNHRVEAIVAVTVIEAESSRRLWQAGPRSPLARRTSLALGVDSSEWKQSYPDDGSVVSFVKGKEYRVSVTFLYNHLVAASGGGRSITIKLVE